MTQLIEAVMYQRLRPEIRVMAQIMERKFRVHNYRGNPFRDLDWGFLQMRQREEQKEFCDAIKARKTESEVFDEAADLMNFILMQAEQYSREWRKANGIKLDSELRQEGKDGE
jgi:hypothetical protein